MGFRLEEWSSSDSVGGAVCFLADRVMGDAIELRASEPVTEGEWVAFEVKLSGGDPVLEGVGRCQLCRATPDAYWVRLGMLQFDVSNEIMFERIQLEVESHESGERTGEINLQKLEQMRASGFGQKPNAVSSSSGPPPLAAATSRRSGPPPLSTGAGSRYPSPSAPAPVSFPVSGSRPPPLRPGAPPPLAPQSTRASYVPPHMSAAPRPIARPPLSAPPLMAPPPLSAPPPLRTAPPPLSAPPRLMAPPRLSAPPSMTPLASTPTSISSPPSLSDTSSFPAPPRSSLPPPPSFVPPLPKPAAVPTSGIAPAGETPLTPEIRARLQPLLLAMRRAGSARHIEEAYALAIELGLNALETTFSK